MTTDDGSSADDTTGGATEPEVVDLDAPEPSPDDTPTPIGRSPRFRTFAAISVLVGVLALGVFIGQINARNVSANHLPVFPGDLVVNTLSTHNGQWTGSLTVINGGEQPVDVLGMEVAGFDLAMTADSVTVPPGERAAADVTLSPDCDAPAGGAAEGQPLALDLATAEAEHAVDATVTIGPERAWRMFNAECAGPAGMAGKADIGITTVTDDVPDGSLPSRVYLSWEGAGAAGQMAEVRSLVPGYILTADSLPVRLGTHTSTTTVDVTWSVDGCDLATSTESLHDGPHFGAVIRAEVDGQTVERSVQGSLPENVALQLGLLAASSCPS